MKNFGTYFKQFNDLLESFKNLTEKMQNLVDVNVKSREFVHSYMSSNDKNYQNQNDAVIEAKDSLWDYPWF